MKIRNQMQKNGARAVTDARQWKCGVSACFGNLEEELFREYSKSGIDCMEISLSAQQCEDINWKKTRELSEKYGVELWSFHLPFWPFESFDISGVSSSDVKAVIDVQKEYIRKFSDIGIKIGVIHPSGEPIGEACRYDAVSRAKESLAEIADFAAVHGAEIAVENLPRTCLGNCSVELADIVYSDSRLRVCYDTNHLLGEDNIHFIENIGDKIITIHVSDYDFINERHWMPGEGKNDWTGIVTALEKAGYNGPFMYEIDLEPPESIRRRTLTFDDFYDNYISCINKRPAKVLGIPQV